MTTPANNPVRRGSHRAGRVTPPMRFTVAVLSSLVALVPGCSSNDAGATTADHAATVDSIVPRPVALARFRTGIDSTDALTGGAASRDELVARFVTALERSDTAALRELTMTRAEFAWVYYPTNPQALPPYDLSPDLFWFMLETRGRMGLTRLLQERGGGPLGYLRTDCPPAPSIEGSNRVWGPCTVTRRLPRGDTVVERLFGPIVERNGRFKFVNFANKLD